MLRCSNGLRDALAFLSRLTSPSSYEATSLARAVPFYPLAGLVLGALATLPYLALSGESWLGAWFYALLLAWLTRGLHWDGLTDLADACGSNATGDMFWTIMKDSRIGAFGVMALVFAALGLIFAAQACAASGRFAALVFAPAFARAAVIALGRLTTPFSGSTLATLTHPGTTSKAALASLVATLAAAVAFLGPAIVPGIFLTALCLGVLVRVASTHGGANGDFYGAAIITVEIAVLFAVSLFPV